MLYQTVKMSHLAPITRHPWMRIEKIPFISFIGLPVMKAWKCTGLHEVLKCGLLQWCVCVYVKAGETQYMDTICVGSWTNAGKDCVQRLPHLISLHVSFTGRSAGKTENWVQPFLSGSLARALPLCFRANVRYKIS